MFRFPEGTAGGEDQAEETPEAATGGYGGEAMAAGTSLGRGQRWPWAHGPLLVVRKFL